MTKKSHIDIHQPANSDILYWFSGIQVWHLEDEFYLIRHFTPSHLTCNVLRTPLIMNILCTSGTIRGTIDGRPFTMHANDTLITLPLQTLRLEYISDDLRCTLVALSRANAEAQNIGNEYTQYENILKNPVLPVSEEQMRAMITITELYAHTIQQRSNPHQREVLLLLQKVNNLLHGAQLHETPTPAGSQAEAERTGSLAMQFNRLLEANYMRQHHIAFYADRLAVTPKYLSTVVMQASGHTAGWWIDYYLMRDAERYLNTTKLSVQAISDLLGFANQSAFGKYFRRQKGVSPANYRNNQTTQNN